MKSKIFWLSFLSMAAITPVQAHITLEQGQAMPGASYKIVLRVPHGCEGSPTTSISVKLPEGVIAAKPMPKAGWQLEVKSGRYGQAYEFYHGIKLSEGAREIAWKGNLPDAYYDEFIIAAFIAKELSPGPLYFSVTQTCGKGEAVWSEIPAAGQDAHSLKFPAPVLNVGGAREHKH